MTAGLNGIGTEVDPWRITTRAEFAAVVRDATSSGYYRVVASLDDGTYQTLAPIGTGTISGYARKVIDFNGYTVRLTGVVTTAFLSVFGGLQLKRGRLILSYGPENGSGLTLFYRCGLEDCAVYLSASSANSSADLTIIDTRAGVIGLEPMVLRRVLFAGVTGLGGGVDSVYTPTLATSGLQVTHAYVRSSKSAWSAAGFVLRTDMSLSALDLLSDSAFTGAGWWLDGEFMLPYQTDAVALTVMSRNAGEPKSRRIWLESSGRVRHLGYTAEDGAGSFTERVLKRASFTVIADEQLYADELSDYKKVESGRLYLPPGSNGFAYAAGSAGQVLTLAGVVFTDQPLTINGVVFTPRAHYPGAISDRLSVVRQGLSQTVVLDNASGGGGGPVIEGDPAYLDGVVEEIHPMLGTVRALANAEVLAFERRGSEYVAMGSAYSNAAGEFRVETEVYGGGDIFAFAADFPGVIWQAGVVLNLGARIRPTVNNGYVYEIVTAGVSGGTEPAWWADAGDGTEGAIGSATAKARPYYQPVGHGPLKMTLVE